MRRRGPATLAVLVVSGCGLLGKTPTETPEQCDDGIDNDRDLRWDGDDPDCVGISDPPGAAVGGGDDDDVDDAGTDTDTDTTCTAVSALEVEVQCRNDVATITVFADGEPVAGEVLLAETSPPAEKWSETHPLAPTAIDACSFDAEVELAAGAAYDEWAEGESTLFRCEEHFNDDYITYVARLDDDRCVAWGLDPEGLLAGVYDDELLNPPGLSFAGCEVLR